MQKQQDIAVSDTSTGIHLQCPTALGKHHLGTGALRTAHRVIRASAIDDDASITLCSCGIDCISHRMRLIEDRHDNGQTAVTGAGT
jgi:hypothetical protein